MKTKMSFYKLGMFQKVVLYEPEEPNEKSKVAVICIHSNADYSDFPAGQYLAEKGYRVLCGQVGRPNSPLYERLNDVKNAVLGARKLPGVEKVVLLGHSGGATMMSCYQSVAEKGCKIYQGEKMIAPIPDMDPLPAADGIFILDSNYGNAVMTAISVDPAVMDEESGMKLNAEYDTFAPENGYSPEGAHYSGEFMDKFLRAQRLRYTRAVDRALERYKAIEAHRGRFIDDEPFCVPGASVIAPNNKLIPQDLRLLSHTEDKYPLIHPDGSITEEVVYSVRSPRGGKCPTPLYGFGAMTDTVKAFITGGAIRLTEEYNIDETHISGLDLDSCYCCTIGNVRYIDCPALIMGMTAGYEYLAAEPIWRNIGSKDKTIAFVEGATHMLAPERGKEGEYGNTVATTFNFADKWLGERFC